MNRRRFLKLLGISAAAPVVVKATENVKIEEPEYYEEQTSVDIANDKDWTECHTACFSSKTHCFSGEWR